MRTTTGLFSILIFGYVITTATCLTNAEFYEIVKDYVTDLEIIEESGSADDVDDDVIDLPGEADDDLDIEYLMQQLGEETVEDISTSEVEYHQPPLERASCRCRRHYCQCCVSKTFKVKVWRRKLKFRLRACVKVAVKRGGFEISFTLNGRRVMRKRYSLRRGFSLCYRVPQFPAAKICLDMYNINLRRRRACARLTGKVRLGWKTYKVHLKLGCFRLPILTEDLENDSAFLTEEFDALREDSDSQQDMTYPGDAIDDEDFDLDPKDALKNVRSMQMDEENLCDDIE